MAFLFSKETQTKNEILETELPDNPDWLQRGHCVESVKLFAKVISDDSFYSQQITFIDR